MPGPAWVPCLPCCLELWAGPCRESSEWLAGPNFTVRPRAHSTRSMGRIPLFSLSGPDNCWYTPSRGLPCWSLGSSPSGGSSRFWLAWGLCTVLLPLPPPPPSTCPEPSVPRTQCQRGRQPCPALSCLAWHHALPCLAVALVSQVQPGRCPPARHCPVTRPSQVQSHAAAAFSLCGLPVSLFPPSPPPPPPPSVLSPAFFLSPASPSPHPHLWLNSSGKSPEVSCLVLTVHSFNPFYLLDS